MNAMFISSIPNPIVSTLSVPHLHSISFRSHFNPFPVLDPTPFSGCKVSSFPSIRNGLRELRVRIETVKITQKITEATKLVAAAKVRKAQEAVVNGRPFAEAIAEFVDSISEQCKLEDVEIPLTTVRPVKRVALIVVTGDRGLCGGFNSAVIKKADARILELKNLGLDCVLISVGKKGNAYFRKRVDVNVDVFIEGGNFPTSKDAQVIADNVFSLFLSEEVDRVEILYTKFVSLVNSNPLIHSLLPLSAKDAMFDVNGKSVSPSEIDYFRLTTKEGKLTVERDQYVGIRKSKMLPNYYFEQDPVQILDALLPLYLNSQILRALQESYASELTARMNAMSIATDNAIELKKSLSIAYSRERQAKITGEILEIVAGAEALR